MDYGFRLDDGETIIKVVHRSIFDVLPTLLISVLLALVALALAYIMGRFPDTTPFPPLVMLALVASMTIIAVLIFLVAYFVYRRNVLIFTNFHIVQVEQLALFQHRVSQISLLRIEDATGQRQGFLETIFNYGAVQIQSAGEQEKFIFVNAPHPEALADEALERHEACVRLAQAGGGNPEAAVAATPPAPTPPQI